MLLHSGLQSPHSLTNVDLAAAAGNPVHNPGMLLRRQSVLHLGQHCSEGPSRLEDHPQVELPADSPDVFTDPRDVG